MVGKEKLGHASIDLQEIINKKVTNIHFSGVKTNIPMSFLYFLF